LLATLLAFFYEDTLICGDLVVPMNGLLMLSDVLVYRLVIAS
jgi:hypothetical protein